MKPPAPPYEKQNTLLVALISKYLYMRNMTKAALATRLHVSLGTLYVRLRNPGDFTVDELRRLTSALGFSEEEKKLIL